MCVRKRECVLSDRLGEVTGFQNVDVCVCVCVDKMSLFLEGGSDDREIGRGFKMKSMMALFFFSLSPLSLSLSLSFLLPSSSPCSLAHSSFSPPLIFCIENLRTKWSRGERERER